MQHHSLNNSFGRQASNFTYQRGQSTNYRGGRGGSYGYAFNKPTDKPITKIVPVGFPKVVPTGFPPIDESKLPPDPKKLPTQDSSVTVSNWIHEIQSNPSPLPTEPFLRPREKEEVDLYEKSYIQGTETGPSSFTVESEKSPFELKMKEVSEDLHNLDIKEEKRKKKEAKVDTSDWPVLKVPGDYDKNPQISRIFENIRTKFHKPDGDNDNYPDSDHDEPLNPVDDVEDHDSILSLEVLEMGSDENKFEASELIEYKDLSWCIAVPIDKERTRDKDVYQYLVYSYQKGIDRIFLTQEQISSFKNTLIIKYRHNGYKTEVLPVYSALPSTGLVSLKYRHNKGIELRLYGVLNFVDFIKDKECMSQKTIVWTDALGPLYLSAADRSNIRRKLMTSEEKTFAPLRMCQLTVKGDFTTSVQNGYAPKWTVSSFQPLIEEANKDPNIGRNLWPARIIRFDDLILQKSNPDRNEHWFCSKSQPEVVVFAGSNLSGIINSAGPEYAENGVMMGFVVPFFMRETFAYYEALIIGPHRVIMMLTEGRFLNYYPKTWPPSVEKMCEKYRVEHEKKRMVRRAPRSMEHRGKEPMKSLGGFNEFHFDFKHDSF